MNRPLEGRRIIVTRAAAQAEALAAPLRDLGATVELIPALEVQPCDDGGLKEAIAHVERFNWLLVTSANGAEAIIAEAHRQQRELDFFGLDIMAVGPGTAKVMFDGGAVQARWAPASWTSADMVRRIKIDPERRAILVVQGTEAPDTLVEQLYQAGGRVTRVNAYRTVVPPALAKQISLFLRSGNNADAVTFTSGQIALNFFRAMRAREVNLPDSTVIASIGPVTTACLRELGYPPAVEAPQQRMSLLANALGEFFGRLP